MKTLTTLLFAALFSFSVLAEESAPIATPPTALVTKLRGEVLMDGHALKVGDTISKPGKIDTKDKSFVQLKIEKWKNFISIGPSSQMILNFSEDKKYTLDNGTCRWKAFAESTSKGKIHTRNASMGVRGTDFFLKANTLLGETEIIMFDGEVAMENAADKENTLVVKKGQWGGLGGRFGDKLRGPIDLPKEVITTTEKSLE
jgi:hypothetical protein